MPNLLKVIGAALLAATAGIAASPSNAATAVTYPSASAMSPNISDLPPAAHFAQGPQDLIVVPPPKPLPLQRPGPGGPDGLRQGHPGPEGHVKPEASFPGIGANGYLPPDPNIAVGPNHIVQVVNSQYAVFNKTGGPVTGPVALSSLWSSLGSGNGCASNNAGDPVVQYDAVADKWLITQLGSTSGPYSECVAVSLSNDPSGAYKVWYYPFTALNDYPKFGVWPTQTNSAYFASYNMFANGQTFTGAKLCAYDRTAMLGAADSPAQICADVPADGGFLPADFDGGKLGQPIADGPGYFLNFETSASLRLYTLAPDFSTASATLTQTSPDIAVAPFTPSCSGGTCVPQTNRQKLDTLADRLMYRLAYRTLGSDAVLVVNHSVDINPPNGPAGVRWYELRMPLSGGAFSVSQQGTFAPGDANWRWMGSAAMDGAGNIALGYSVSGSTMYPGIAFTGRTPDMAAGTMGAETMLQPGNGSQTTYSRWGDYTSLRVDPSDDTTFWYTNEYYDHNSAIFNFNWNTAIGSFTISAAAITPADFDLVATPQSLTVSRGGSASAIVTVTATNKPSSVTLSLNNPAKTTASFSPNPVSAATTPGVNSTLTISANRKATRGTYSLTITGSNGQVSHGIPLTLMIQ